MTDVVTNNGVEPPYPPPPPPPPLESQAEPALPVDDDDGTPPWLRGEYRKARDATGQLTDQREPDQPGRALATVAPGPDTAQLTVNRRTAVLVGAGVLLLGYWWVHSHQPPAATPAAPTETTVKVGGLKTVADKDRVVANTDGRVCVVRFDALRVAGGDIEAIKAQIQQANTFFPGTPVDDLYIGGGGTADQVIVTRQRSTNAEVKLVACPDKPTPPSTTTTAPPAPKPPTAPATTTSTP